jgi:hypothetical protein
MGHGVKSVIVWRTKSPASPIRLPYSLHCDSKNYEAHKSNYAMYLRNIQWDEKKAKQEMK